MAKARLEAYSKLTPEERAKVKWCSTCKQVLGIEQFSRNKTSSDGLQSECKPCRAERFRSVVDQRTPEEHRAHLDRELKRKAALSTSEKRRRASRLFYRRMGITLEERDDLLRQQGGRCLLCGTAEPAGVGWVVDHDHSCCSGRYCCGLCVRGILCAQCNSGLGFFSERLDVLERAIAYLRKEALPSWHDS